MAEIPHFEHNGITIERSEAPPPMGLPGPNVVGWVVTAPDKDESIPFNKPIPISNLADVSKLDPEGKDRGTGWRAVYETLRRTKVLQYVVVVPEAENVEDTFNNVLGGYDAETGQRTGIAALSECDIKPTIIAAPGFSHKKTIIDALVVVAKKIRCRVVADGPSLGEKAAINLSKELGGEGAGYERVYLVDVMPMVYSKAAKDLVFVPPSTMAVGAMAAVAQWESPGNQGVYIEGLKRTVEYSIADKTTEGSRLNKFGVSYFTRLDQGGYILVGNRSVTGEFIPHVGLEDEIARRITAVSQRTMSKNLTRVFMEQEINKLNNFLKRLVAEGILPGGGVYLDPVRNNVDSYKNGTWYIVFAFGRYSPNEHMVMKLNADDKYIEEFLGDVIDGR